MKRQKVKSLRNITLNEHIIIGDLINENTELNKVNKEMTQIINKNEEAKKLAAAKGNVCELVCGGMYIIYIIEKMKPPSKEMALVVFENFKAKYAERYKAGQDGYDKLFGGKLDGMVFSNKLTLELHLYNSLQGNEGAEVISLGLTRNSTIIRLGLGMNYTIQSLIRVLWNRRFWDSMFVRSGKNSS